MQTATPAVMLVIGDVSGWQERGRDLPSGDGLHFAGFPDVSAALLRKVQPDIVLSALLGPDFDVVEVAALLERLKFTGRYRAVCPSVPQPELIIHEVQQKAPNLDFNVMVLDGTEPLTAG